VFFQIHTQLQPVAFPLRQVEDDDVASSPHIKPSVFARANNLLIRASSVGWSFLRLMKHSRICVAPVFDFET
jgi:hypothetical protein